MAEGCRNSVAHFRTVGIDMIEIFKVITVMDFLPRAKLLMRKEWQEIWNCCDGNKLHAINPTVGVTKQNDSRSRRDAVILNRLQIGHTRATHAHLLGDDEAFCADCATCYTSLTVNHILIECPQFNHLRDFANNIILVGH